MGRNESVEDFLTRYCASVHAMDFDLKRLQSIAGRAFTQPLQCPYVLVGGTNAKGSTVCLLTEVLAKEGFVVGRYTSPHLVDCCERIVLGRRKIDQAQLLDFLKKIHGILKPEEFLTFFEYLTLAAIFYFEQQHAKGCCHLAILEVGLGGRLDATNIVEPILSVVTNVGLDHCDILGACIEDIAFEKSGIMRQGRPTIFVAENVPDVVCQQAQKIGSHLLLTKRLFEYERVSPDQLILRSNNAQFNLDVHLSPFLASMDVPDCVLGVCHALRHLKTMGFEVSQGTLMHGLRDFKMDGRRQAIDFSGRHFLLDVGHNSDAIVSLGAYLRHLNHKKVYCIFYALSDKDIAAMLQILDSLVHHWFIVGSLGCEREPTASQWSNYLDEIPGLSHQFCADLHKALKNSISASNSKDLLLVVGSFILVGEFLKCVERGGF